MDKDKHLLRDAGELEVVLSLMEEGELRRLQEGVEYLIGENAYQRKDFPLSCSGLRWVVHYISTELARRRGMSTHIVRGETLVSPQSKDGSGEPPPAPQPPELDGGEGEDVIKPRGGVVRL